MYLFHTVVLCVVTAHDMSALCPPDKGTVQKVIVLPSNQSLHEDLILEELEVFKVSCLFFSPFFFHSTLTFIPFLSHKSGGGGSGAGVHLATTQRPGADRQRHGGTQEIDVLQCSAAQSDGKHANIPQGSGCCPQ